MEEKLEAEIEAIEAKMHGIKAKLKPCTIRDYHLTIEADPIEVVYAETPNYKVCVAGWSETHYDDDIEGCFLNNTQFRVSSYTQRKGGKEIREQQLKRIVADSFVGRSADPESKYTRIKLLPVEGDRVKVVLVSEECLADFLAGPTFEVKLE